MTHPHFQKSMLRLAALALATGIATIAAPAGAAGTSADKGFIEKAAIGGMAEVEMGNLAQQKASNEQVKQFGSRMVQDHGKANAELKQIAGAKGIDLPSALEGEHKKELERLSRLSGSAFDREYMHHMVADHKKDIAEFQNEAKSGKDSEVKAFADKSLPTLRDHLKQAESVNDAVKHGKTTASSS